MRILYYYPHQQYNTGSPKSLVSMINHLDKEMYTPVFLSTKDGELTRVLKGHHVEIITGCVNSISLKKPFNAISLIYKQILFLKKYTIKIVHFNHFGWNEDLAIAAYLIGIPVIHHIHNAVKIQSYNLNRFAANLFLTCSKTLQKDIINFHYISKKTKILYNLVDLNLIQSGKSIRQKLDLTDSDIAVGTIAQICHRKGIDIFVESAQIALEKNPNLIFFIVGPDGLNEEQYSKEMRAKISLPLLKNRVRILGSRSDIPDILKSLDIFMFTTRSEPFGIVVIEAMAAGLPVIASKIGGIPEIINDKQIGVLIDSLEPILFSKAVIDIAGLHDMGKSIALAGQKSLIGRFDSETIGQNLSDIYQSLIKT